MTQDSEALGMKKKTGVRNWSESNTMAPAQKTTNINILDTFIIMIYYETIKNCSIDHVIMKYLFRGLSHDQKHEFYPFS